MPKPTQPALFEDRNVDDARWLEWTSKAAGEQAQRADAKLVPMIEKAKAARRVERAVAKEREDLADLHRALDAIPEDIHAACNTATELMDSGVPRGLAYIKAAEQHRLTFQDVSSNYARRAALVRGINNRKR